MCFFVIWQFNLVLFKYVQDVIDIFKVVQYDFIILEIFGIGQFDMEIIDYFDMLFYVMMLEYGAVIQLEKIDMFDFVDVIVINKFDKWGVQDVFWDVKKQYQCNNMFFDKLLDEMLVIGIIVFQFNDLGMNKFYCILMDVFVECIGADLKFDFMASDEVSEKIFIILFKWVCYFLEIFDFNCNYDDWVDWQE